MASWNIADGQLAAATAVIVPTGGPDKELTVTCYNTDTSSQSVTLTVSRAGGTARTVVSVTLGPGESLQLTGMSLGSSDTLNGYSGNASKVDYVVSATDLETPLKLNVYDNTGAIKSGAAAASGAIGTVRSIIKKTAIVDATATSFLTVTCPNANASAALKLTILSAVNNAGALDSARVAEGLVAFSRIAGAALVGTAATLTLTAIATSGTATLTLAYSLGTVGGAVGAVNTMDVKVTLTKTGGTNHQIVVLAELVNSEASGITLAAA